ncbi:MAG: 4,5-DOPA dioxygenase extradiol [Elusimicrobiota bacterium]|nr:MAG: 4,5-DOPA dioxygenase extradiol [Elusimicrobiota bacterium]
MHALADNAFTRALGALGKSLGKPKSILCVSAHWYGGGASVTHMEKPETIHDFGGFPDELFAVRYPAPGSPKLAERAAALTGATLDDADWGFDHGAWAVLKHMYPEADVPVVQLGIDAALSPAAHLARGRALAPLREEGVLILGSGNVVHNLRLAKWTAHPEPYAWNVEFDAHVKTLTEQGKFDELAGDTSSMPGGQAAVPTPDHWLPYLYVLGAAGKDPVRWAYEGFEMASMSMRCAVFGA